MKKIALASLIVVAATLAIAPPSDARFRGHFGHRPVVHTRVFIGVGPAFYYGPYPYWYYPPPYYYPPPPPVVIQETPPVYIQQPPPPPSSAPSAAGEQFWYYCPSANAYYPSVSSCPEAWVKVAPRQQ